MKETPQSPLGSPPPKGLNPAMAKWAKNEVEYIYFNNDFAVNN